MLGFMFDKVKSTCNPTYNFVTQSSFGSVTSPQILRGMDPRTARLLDCQVMDQKFWSKTHDSVDSVACRFRNEEKLIQSFFTWYNTTTVGLGINLNRTCSIYKIQVFNRYCKHSLINHFKVNLFVKTFQKINYHYIK